MPRTKFPSDVPDDKYSSGYLKVSQESARQRILEHAGKGNAIIQKFRNRQIDEDSYNKQHRNWRMLGAELLNSLFTTDSFAAQFGYAETIDKRSSFWGIDEQSPNVCKGIESQIDFLENNVIPRMEFCLPPESITAASPLVAKAKGTKIFLGHGGSKDWQDVRDFIRDKLHLEYEEFSRISTAGYMIPERIAEMLDIACFAFCIFTGEDEHADASRHARENVIHEAGLFQGRLGYRKAILILEDGCQEFSNIKGLVQLRYPKGHIRAVYEEIRDVLKKEFWRASPLNIGSQS